MTPSPSPCQTGLPDWVDDPARLGELRSYGIVGSGAEGVFDDIARLAKDVCDASVALVSFVEVTRQWFKATAGTELTQTPVGTSICAFTLHDDRLLEVPDTAADPRFADMAVVTEMGMRFYAGAPLRSPDGHGLGALCVLDTRPRTLDDAQKSQLMALARLVMAQLETRRALTQAERALHAHRQLVTAAARKLADPLMRMELVLHDVARLPALEADDREQLAMAKQDYRTVGDALRRITQATLMDRRSVGSETVTVAAVLERLHAQWYERAEADGRALVFQPVDASLDSNADLVALVLDALMANAFDHATGTISIESGVLDRGVWIAVCDAGPGMSDAREKQVRDSLAQATTDGFGLGMGLSVAQRAAELLGADLSVHSAPGHGSRFLLRLPDGHRNTVAAVAA